MPGLNKYDEKSKRRERRHNHVARDLASVKYRQRIIRNKKKDEDDYDPSDPDA